MPGTPALPQMGSTRSVADRRSTGARCVPVDARPQVSRGLRRPGRRQTCARRARVGPTAIFLLPREIRVPPHPLLPRGRSRLAPSPSAFGRATVALRPRDPLRRRRRAGRRRDALVIEQACSLGTVLRAPSVRGDSRRVEHRSERDARARSSGHRRIRVRGCADPCAPCGRRVRPRRAGTSRPLARARLRRRLRLGPPAQRHGVRDPWRMDALVLPRRVGPTFIGFDPRARSWTCLFAAGSAG